jgi:hypothetical protein
LTAFSAAHRCLADVQPHRQHDALLLLQGGCGHCQLHGVHLAQGFRRRLDRWHAGRRACPQQLHHDAALLRRHQLSERAAPPAVRAVVSQVRAARVGSRGFSARVLFDLRQLFQVVQRGAVDAVPVHAGSGAERHLHGFRCSGCHAGLWSACRPDGARGAARLSGCRHGVAKSGRKNIFVSSATHVSTKAAQFIRITWPSHEFAASLRLVSHPTRRARTTWRARPHLRDTHGWQARDGTHTRPPRMPRTSATRPFPDICARHCVGRSIAVATCALLRHTRVPQAPPAATASRSSAPPPCCTAGTRAPPRWGAHACTGALHTWRAAQEEGVSAFTSSPN